MPRSKSSRRWLDEHINDPYVKQAQQEGFRSRAAYKLLEIQAKDHVLKPGMTVVDLGAAPGSWSEVASRLLGPDGRIFALDILPMTPIPDVTILQGDFTEATTLDALLQAIGQRPVDLVMSDMAPHISGITSVDQPKAMHLVDLAVDLAEQVLKPGGALLIKVFQGEGFDPLVKRLRQRFRKVIIRKPNASRARSREVYLLGLGAIL